MLLDVGNHLWQSTLFAVVIAGLCYLLRRDGAHVRYGLCRTTRLRPDSASRGGSIEDDVGAVAGPDMLATVSCPARRS
jgi:hypothetical protein